MANIHHVPICNMNVAASSSVGFKQHTTDPTIPVESTSNCARMATRENKYTQQQQQQQQQRAENVQERSTEV